MLLNQRDSRAIEKAVGEYVGLFLSDEALFHQCFTSWYSWMKVIHLSVPGDHVHDLH